MGYIILIKNKMKFVIAALLGLVAASQVETTNEVIGHKKRLAILNNLIQIDEGSESDSDDSDAENVQLGKCANCYGEVPAYMDKSDAAGGYKREMPDRFTEERDDQLMNSVIGNY